VAIPFKLMKTRQRKMIKEVVRDKDIQCDLYGEGNNPQGEMI
jgi:hypothetical protein